MRVIKQTSATTDSEVIASWLSDKSSRSRSTYAGAVRQFLSFTGKPLAELCVEDLQQWVRSFELRNYSQYTIKLKINTVKSLLTYCHEVGYLPLNIGKRVKPPNPKNGLSQRILTQDDVEKLILAAANEILRSTVQKALPRAQKFWCALCSADLFRFQPLQHKMQGESTKNCAQHKKNCAQHRKIVLSTKKLC